MPEGTARSGLKASARLAQVTVEMMIKFLEVLAQIQNDKNKYASARAMGKWIEQGGGLLEYSIQGTTVSAMFKAELMKNDIPYLEDKNGKVLIRDCDEKKALEINRDCLIRKGNYYQIVGMTEFDNAIARSDAEDKEMFKISNLPYIQMECLKRKCNDISLGFMIGSRYNEQTGNYDICVYGPKVCEYDPDHTDFCEASLRAAFSLYGPNEDIKVDQVMNDLEMSKKIAALRDQPGTHWLVSQFNPNEYIQFNNDESTGKFSFQVMKRRKGRDGKTEVTLLQSLDSEDPDFDVELVRASDRIKNKILIDSEEEFASFCDGELERTSDRLNKTKDQRRISMAEDKFTDKINVMIKNKCFKNHKGDLMNAEERFTTYRKNVEEICRCVEDGTVPKGYSEEDMKELSDIIKEGGAEMKDYQSAMEFLEKLDTSVYKAEKKKEKKVTQSRKDVDEIITKRTEHAEEEVIR